MSSFSILVLGSGFVGKRLYSNLKMSNLKVNVASRTSCSPHIIALDLLDIAAVRAYLTKLRPSVVINTAGLASYFRCQLDEALSYSLNFKVNDILTRVLAETESKLVFLSSSYIFSGKSGNYTEDDTDYSSSVYSSHKRLAEGVIMARLENFLILRLETLFGEVTQGKWRVGSTVLDGEIKTIDIRLLRQPISDIDLAIIIDRLIEVSARGVYNVAGEGKIEYNTLLNYLQTKSVRPFSIVYDNVEDWVVKPPSDTTLSLKKIRELGICLPTYSFSY
jgi:dTDP-4-dehydrorhamnose reductase